LHPSLSPTSSSLFMMRFTELLAISQCRFAQGVDYAQFVNPFIGSEGAIPGYACTTAVIPCLYLLTDSRWRRRCFRRRCCALWYGKAGNRYIRRARQSERTKWWIYTQRTCHGNQLDASVRNRRRTKVSCILWEESNSTSDDKLSRYGFPAQMPLTAIDGDVNLLDNRTYWQDRVR